MIDSPVALGCILSSEKGLLFALNTNDSIFQMVENAYKVTLAGAFVPLFFGAFWKRATTQGALTAIFCGLASWLAVEAVLGDDSIVPPQLIGFAMSILGMIAGSLLPQRIGLPSAAPVPAAAMAARGLAESSVRRSDG
jgi:Na+/proline symporter